MSLFLFWWSAKQTRNKKECIVTVVYTYLFFALTMHDIHMFVLYTIQMYPEYHFI